MAIRMIFSGSQQIIEEVCEHCGEKVRDVHISDIVVKAPNDPRTLSIRNIDNERVRVKTIEKKISDVTESFIRKQLLDETEAREAFRSKKLKYGVRPEAMCSESIDIDARVTQSFCYRVEENPERAIFKTKIVGGRSLSASLARAEKSDTTGSRMGIDRKGNVIKMNRYKNLRLDKRIGEEEVEKDDRGIEKERKKGAFETTWFEELSDRDKESVIDTSQRCEAYIRRYGEEVKTMKVVARYRSISEWKDDIISHGCRT